MATNTDDIITEEEVRAIMEQRREPTVQFRRAFKDHDATDVNSNSFTFPKPADEGGDFDEEDYVEIDEGEEYPRTGLSYDGETVVYSKYGFEFAFSDEAESDSVFDLETDQLGRQIAAEERRLDRIAFGIVNDNHRANTVGDANGELSSTDVTSARTTLWADEYNMGEFQLLTGPDAMEDVLNALSDRSTDLGDGTLMGGETPTSDMNSGFLGVFAGVPAYATNTGVLGEGEAFLVATESFGYESTRWNTETEVYREQSTDETVAKIRRRLGFAPIDPDAAVKIEG